MKVVRTNAGGGGASSRHRLFRVPLPAPTDMHHDTDFTLRTDDHTNYFGVFGRALGAPALAMNPGRKREREGERARERARERDGEASPRRSLTAAAKC